jgi:hypothetical protein
MTRKEKTALLATGVMGWQKYPHGYWVPQENDGSIAMSLWEEEGHLSGAEGRAPRLWQPFERIEHAWTVIDAMVAQGWRFDYKQDKDGCFAEFFRMGRCRFAEDATSGPTAICEAAGRAMGLWDTIGP